MRTFKSWGRTRVSESRLVKVPESGARGNLCVGSGLSYGDSCLNSQGNILLSAFDDNLLSFSEESETISAEAGCTFDQLLRFLVPKGFFVPVSPGTKFVTLGGAIANDVHGKNHHKDGSLGPWIQGLVLERSDGKFACDRSRNPELFAATIGGLGLTGRIVSAELRLKRIPSAYVDQRIERFWDLEEFFEISQRESASDYTVAWLDQASSKSDGRGLFISGNFSEEGGLEAHGAPRFQVPVDLPEKVLSPVTMRLFNSAYYNQQLVKVSETQVHYDSFFYPLDKVGGWNRIYGRRGFYQFQCVIPREDALRGLREILRVVTSSGHVSFLSVLKFFGDRQSPGLLSFPRPGLTVSLDFPNRGEETSALFKVLYDLVLELRGRVYPAKDALMSAEHFAAAFPEYGAFKEFRDPRFSSDFIRRVAE